jgi:D-cysteine desulfhydrase family pyridoxal phosphate-dependent enzyme
MEHSDPASIPLSLAGAVARFPLARLPTPIHDAPHLRAALGGESRCPRILLKRDDLTDLALGGNKARKLEFLVADALAAGASTLITSGGPQSNHARMTAAAAKRAGMKCVLVLSGPDSEPVPQGNLLLDHLLGARVERVEGGDDAELERRERERIDAVTAELEAAGERPYVIPVGGSSGVGVLGYVDATLEIVNQLAVTGEMPTRLYYASGSRGTQAGLELGARLHGVSWRCTGVAVSGGEAEKRERAVRIGSEAAALLSVDVALEADAMETVQDQIGEGYALPTRECVEAIEMLAATESVFLDPVYTGKAMAGLIAHIRSERIAPDETVIFLHTGGAPGLFGLASRLAPLIASG